LIDRRLVPPAVGDGASDSTRPEFCPWEATALEGAVEPLKAFSRLMADPTAARATKILMTPIVMFRDQWDGFFGGFR
jgi:hypothetical protein